MKYTIYALIVVCVAASWYQPWIAAVTLLIYLSNHLADRVLNRLEAAIEDPAVKFKADIDTIRSDVNALKMHIGQKRREL